MSILFDPRWGYYDTQTRHIYGSSPPPDLAQQQSSNYPAPLPNQSMSPTQSGSPIAFQPPSPNEQLQQASTREAWEVAIRAVASQYVDPAGAEAKIRAGQASLGPEPWKVNSQLVAAQQGDQAALQNIGSYLQANGMDIDAFSQEYLIPKESNSLMKAASYLPYLAMAGMGGLAFLPTAGVEVGAGGAGAGTAGAGTYSGMALGGGSGAVGGVAPAISSTAPAIGGGLAGGTTVGDLVGAVAPGVGMGGMGELAALPASAAEAGTGVVASGAGTAGAGGIVLPSGFNVDSGVGLGSITGGSLGFAGPAASGGTVSGTGLGLTAPGISAGIGTTAASGGLSGFLNSLFGGGAGTTGTGGIGKDILALGALGQGALDLYSSGQREDAAREAASLADPFASQRRQYQAQLAKLMADPSSINQDSAYLFRLKSGQDMLERSNAARGYLGSGNILHELQDYGQRSASEELGTQRNFLAGLAGSGFGPGTAGSNYMQGQQGSLAQQYQGLSQLGTLGGRALTNLFSNNNNSQYSLV